MLTYKEFDMLELSRGINYFITYSSIFKTLSRTKLEKVAAHKNMKYTDVGKSFPL